MTTLTIRAEDSAQALEEVMRCLGPDALILSTRAHKGQIEVVAAPAGGAPAPGATALDRAPASGFASQLLRHIVGGQRASSVLPPHLPTRVVLIGPPGAGCSTLAARLAAEALRCPGARHPVLIAPRPDILAAPGRLASHARLLGLVPHRPVWHPDQPLPLARPAIDKTQIVDLSEMPQVEPAHLAELCSGGDAALWLVLPTGLHPDLLANICARFAPIAAHVVLTRTDLCAPTAEDLELPSRHALQVTLLSGGAGLLDALTPVPPANPAPFRTAATVDLDQSQEELPDASARLS